MPTPPSGFLPFLKKTILPKQKGKAGKDLQVAKAKEWATLWLGGKCLLAEVAVLPV